jgi:predicted nucleic-acid-binding protein
VQTNPSHSKKLLRITQILTKINKVRNQEANHASPTQPDCLRHHLNIKIEDEASVEVALFLWKNATIGFTDCLIGSKHQRLGCHTTATFDSKAAKLPCFMPVCP